jgi:hypothetical protein
MITITQAPTGSLTSAGNNNYYVVKSETPFSMSAYNDFYYIADVIVTNATYPTGSQVARLVSYPDSNGYGTFDLQNIANSFVSYDFPGYITEDVLFFNTASNSSAQIQLEFGERYVYNSTFSQSYNLNSSDTIGYCNGSLSWSDQNYFDYNRLIMTPSISGSQFLTDYYSVDYNGYKDLRNWLYFYNLPPSGVLGAILTTNDGAGNVVGSYTFSNPYSSVLGVQYISVGYPQLKQLPTSSYTVLTGSVTIINPNVVTYTIQLTASGSNFVIDADSAFLVDFDGTNIVDAGVTTNYNYLEDYDSIYLTDYDGATLITDGLVSNIAISNPITFTVMNNCGKFRDTSVAIYWLSKLGGFESVLMNKMNVYTKSKVIAQYLKNNVKTNSSGRIVQRAYDMGLTNFYTQITNNIKFNSDFVSDAQAEWIAGMFQSPVIFVQTHDGVIQAANVVEDTYEVYKQANKKLNSVSLTLELGQNDYSQRL